MKRFFRWIKSLFKRNTSDVVNRSPANTTDVVREPDRPSKSEPGQMALWYPDAQILSPRMRTRGKYTKGYPEGAVVHFTAGRDDGPGTVAWGREQGYCFFVIDGRGQVYQSFPLNEWGYHAGKSYWPSLGHSVSDHLVGIEICCAGRLEKSGSKFRSWFGEYYSAEQVRYSSSRENIQEGYYHKCTEAQEESLIKLLHWMKSQAPTVFSYDLVLGHDEVSPGRKNDPGASLSMTMNEFRKRL